MLERTTSSCRARQPPSVSVCVNTAATRSKDALARPLSSLDLGFLEQARLPNAGLAREQKDRRSAASDQPPHFDQLGRAAGKWTASRLRTL